MKFVLFLLTLLMFRCSRLFHPWFFASFVVVVVGDPVVSLLFVAKLWLCSLLRVVVVYGLRVCSLSALSSPSFVFVPIRGSSVVLCRYLFGPSCSCCEPFCYGSDSV